MGKEYVINMTTDNLNLEDEIRKVIDDVKKHKSYKCPNLKYKDLGNLTIDLGEFIKDGSADVKKVKDEVMARFNEKAIEQLDKLINNSGVKTETVKIDGDKSIYKYLYKEKDLASYGLDGEKYKDASPAEQYKMMEEAEKKVDDELGKDPSDGGGAPKKYMTVRDLVEMSVAYYTTTGGKAFNSFVLNDKDFRLDDPKYKDKYGKALAGDALVKAVLSDCVDWVDKSHDKTKEERKDLLNAEKGKTPAGGTPAAGGATPAGGTPPVGGATPAGGTPAGGTPAGGTPAGGTPAGGTPPVGGATPAGGTPTPTPAAKRKPIIYPGKLYKKITSNRDKNKEKAHDFVTDLASEPPTYNEKDLERISDEEYRKLLYLTEDELKGHDAKECKAIIEKKKEAFIRNYEILKKIEAFKIAYESNDKDKIKAAKESLESIGKTSEEVEKAILEALEQDLKVQTITLCDYFLDDETHFKREINGLEVYKEYGDRCRALKGARAQSKSAREFTRKIKEIGNGDIEENDDIAKARLKEAKKQSAWIRGIASKKVNEAWLAKKAIQSQHPFRVGLKAFEESMKESIYGDLAKNPEYDDSPSVRKHQNIPRFDAEKLKELTSDIGKAYERLDINEDLKIKAHNKVCSMKKNKGETHSVDH